VALDGDVQEQAGDRRLFRRTGSESCPDIP
jgi:hypothetical protein